MQNARAILRGLAIAAIAFTTVGSSTWLLMSVDLDNRKAIYWDGMTTLDVVSLLLLLTILAVAVVVAIRMRRTRADPLSIVIRVGLMLSLGVPIPNLLYWANIKFDRSAVERELVVKDAFTVFRGDSDQFFVAVSASPEHDRVALVLLPVWSDLADYPIGRRIAFTWHDGWLGRPWCEYADRGIAHGDPYAELRWRERSGRITSARGEFSEDSPYKRQLEAWGMLKADTVP